MSSLPPITISRLDWDRLDAMLESAEVSKLPGIASLRAELDRADVVEPGEVPADVATMDSQVRFIDDASGQTFDMMLTWPRNANTPGTVSILAPVGSALLGLRVGQTIQWTMPGGRNTELRLLEVEHSSDHA